MSDFTTPQDGESRVSTRPPVEPRARGLLHAPVFSRLATVYGLWIAVAALYWPSAMSLNALWTQPSQEEAYTHGYLVLLISLWLIFHDRKRLAAVPERAEPRALIALALLSAAWVWAWRAAIQEPHMMLLPLLLFTVIVAALGWRVARVLAFPIGYLYFAMPMWSDINGSVQMLSAKMSGVLIWITGLPAYVQGDYVHLPGGTIEIANTCSGLHELIVGLALATLYGKVSGEPWRRRLQWIGVMGALSLAVNWVRIFTVLAAAYFTHMHSSLVRHHYWLGWWLFAAVFALFLWWTGRQPATGDHGRAPQAHRPEAAPGRGFSLPQMTVALAVMAVLPVLAYGMDWAHAGTGTMVTIQWPAAPAGWTGPQPVAGGAWQPRFNHPGGESLVSYTDAGGTVEAFAVAYKIQTQHAKLISYWNHLLGNKERLRPESVRIINSPSGRWRETLAVDSAGTRSLIWARYRIGSRLFVRPRLSQLWYGLEALLLRPPISSLTALRAICMPDCRTARTRLSIEAPDLQPAFR